ncbi:MAG: glycosyltransferase family 1 protein [Acidobacteriia bacterium]|nr:glycosyltransferase family 1 protein [Terriglobia bacterium]
MLHDFQDEIARLTGASLVEIPQYAQSGLARKFSPATRYAGLRRFLRRRDLAVEADVLWVVLMGPEEWVLDLYKDWDRRVGFKILYLFDTMERQVPLIRRLLDGCKWDCAITSFSGAAHYLENQTQRKWECVPQGVKLSRFHPFDEAVRPIGFCSYGRRLSQVHESLKKFCRAAGCYYDYTTAAGLRADTKPQDHYDVYAWHLRHSIFNVSWPVELTNPGRVESFSPITCRWFEAAASGNVVIGKAPRDPGFTELFGPDAVIEIDAGLSSDDLEAVWRELWEARARHLEAAGRRYRTYSSNWSWKRRVEDILKLAGLPGMACEPPVLAGAERN